MSEKLGEPSAPLTPKQIENWRTVLCRMVGPYALVMPVSQIEKMRDKFQSVADASGNDPKKEETI